MRREKFPYESVEAIGFLWRIGEVELGENRPLLHGDLDKSGVTLVGAYGLADGFPADSKIELVAEAPLLLNALKVDADGGNLKCPFFAPAVP
jgi:hypothetical protein